MGSLANSGHYYLFWSSMLFPCLKWSVILFTVVSSDVVSLLTLFGNLAVQTGRGSCQHQSLLSDNMSSVNQRRTIEVSFMCLVFIIFNQTIVG